MMDIILGTIESIHHVITLWDKHFGYLAMNLDTYSSSMHHASESETYNNGPTLKAID